jgi:chitinase
MIRFTRLLCSYSPSRRKHTGQQKQHRLRVGLLFLSCFLPALSAVAQTDQCSLNLSITPASPVASGQPVTVTVSRNFPAMSTVTAPVSMDGQQFCNFANPFIDPQDNTCPSSGTTFSNLSAGNHTVSWTCTVINDPNAGPPVNGSQSFTVNGTNPKILTGYFPEWGPGSHYYVKNVVTSGSAPILTIINYAFANVANNSCAIADSNADYQQRYTAANSVDGTTDSTSGTGLFGSFHQLQELKSKYPNLKVLISLGGAKLSSGFKSAAQPGNVAGFVSSCIDMFINGNIAPGVSAPGLFDGIDINWEWPGSADTSNYVNMLAMFRNQLDAIRPNLLLTIAGTPGSWATGPQPLSSIHPYLNYINIETYGYAGPWEKTTNFVAPLYGPSGSPTAAHNIDATVQSYLAAGVPPSKLLMGVPFFAYDWTSVPNTNNGLYQMGTPDPAGATYAHVAQILPHFQQFRDPVSQEPWLFDGSTFWTFDDPTSIAFKMNYLKSQGLAGAMLWNLDQDTSTGTLIQAVHAGLQ